MARKRMIDPSIWQDEEFGSLSANAKVLFVGLFSNADDEGRIRANNAYIKSTVFMYDNLTLNQIRTIRDEVSEKMTTVKLYQVNGKEYIQLENWGEYQKQHKDRIQKSTLPPYDENVSDDQRENAAAVSDIVGQIPDNVGVGKVKIREDKLDKDRRRDNVSTSDEQIEKSRKETLDDITDGDIKEIAGDYQVSEAFILSKIDDIRNYCSSKGKTYKDYKATLRNWVKKDALERREHATRDSAIAYVGEPIT